MNVEQRLLDAFREADHVEPSPDLFSRVVHSIEEDRQHRKRALQAALLTLATVGALVAVGILGLVDGPWGTYVHEPTMEFIQVLALIAVAVTFGPAIRRFGRGYATDLWPSTPSTAAGLLRLLDVAYFLIVAGYILVTTTIAFDEPGPNALVADQLQHTGFRLGGLLLLLGLLHAVSLVVLPLVALIENSTRLGKALPRWINALLVLAGAAVGFQLLMMLLGLVAAGFG